LIGTGSGGWQAAEEKRGKAQKWSQVQIRVVRLQKSGDHPQNMNKRHQTRGAESMVDQRQSETSREGDSLTNSSRGPVDGQNSRKRERAKKRSVLEITDDSSRDEGECERRERHCKFKKGSSEEGGSQTGGQAVKG